MLKTESAPAVPLEVQVGIQTKRLASELNLITAVRFDNPEDNKLVLFAIEKRAQYLDNLKRQGIVLGFKIDALLAKAHNVLKTAGRMN